MINNILVYGKMFSGKTDLIKEIYEDLGSLLRIQGFYTQREYSNNTLEGINYYTFRDRQNIFSINLKNTDILQEQIKKFNEAILSKISLFPGPDLFLLDEIGRFECSSTRFYQQIITIFSSRVPVIASTSALNFNEIRELRHRPDICFFKIDPNNSERIYMEILNRLG